MADVTSKYEVELSAAEQQALNNGEAVTIDLPDSKVDLTASSGGSLDATQVPQRDDEDVEVDEDVSLDDLEQEVREAQGQESDVELQGGDGGNADTGLIEKNPDR